MKANYEGSKHGGNAMLVFGSRSCFCRFMHPALHYLCLQGSDLLGLYFTKIDVILFLVSSYIPFNPSACNGCLVHLLMQSLLSTPLDLRRP